MLNLAILYFSGLVALMACIYFGGSVLKAIKSALIDTPWFHFFGGLVGVTLVVTIYAIITTGGKTVMLFNLPLLGVLLYAFRRKAGGLNMMPSVHVSEDNNSLIKTLVLPLTAIYTGSWLWFLRVMTGNGKVGNFQLPHFDEVYYTKASMLLNSTGIEANSMRLLLEKTTDSLLPYHYFEIWLNALFCNLMPNQPEVVVFELIALPILFGLVGLGFYALAKEMKLPIWVALIAGTAYVMFTGLKAHHSSAILDIVRLNFESFWYLFAIDEQLGLAFWVKEISILLFLLPAIYSVYTKNYIAAMVLLTLIMLQSIVTVPMVVTCIGFIILLHIRHLKTIFKLALIPAVTLGSVFLFYKINTVPNSGATTAGLDVSIFIKALGNKTVFISWSMIKVVLLHCTFPLFLIAISMVLKPSIITRNRRILLDVAPFILMTLGGVFTYIMFSDYFNGSQFFTVVTGPIMKIFSVFSYLLFCHVVLDILSNRSAQFKIFGMIICVVVPLGWFGYGYKSNLFGINLRGEMFHNKTDFGYLQRCASLMATKKQDDKVGYIFSPSKSWDYNWNMVPSICPTGNSLMLLKTHTFAIPVSAFTDAKYQAMPEIKDMVKDATFYHFYQSAKAANASVSMLEAQKAFIKKYNIKYLYVDALTESQDREGFVSMVSDSVTDPAYKERFWKLKD